MRKRAPHLFGHKIQFDNVKKCHLPWIFELQWRYRFLVVYFFHFIQLKSMEEGQNRGEPNQSILAFVYSVYLLYVLLNAHTFSLHKSLIHTSDLVCTNTFTKHCTHTHNENRKKKQKNNWKAMYTYINGFCI